MKKSNLKPWTAGISGNPKGRPKGARSVKKTVVALLNDPNTNNWLPRNALKDTQTPLEAIISMLMMKSILGDVRAADVLLRYAIDREELAEEPHGLFDGRPKTIRFEVVDTDGNVIDDDAYNGEATRLPEPIPEASQIVKDEPIVSETSPQQTDPNAGQLASTQEPVKTIAF